MTDEESKRDQIKSNSSIIECQLEILKDIIKAHNEVRERAIKYTYQLITAIGVVAGFGFTAISSVKIILLFILGESLLFSAMAFGMRFVRKGFIDEAALYATYVQRVSKAIDDRKKICVGDTLENIRAQMKSAADNDSKIFSDEKPADINSKFFFTMILYLFIAGGVLLLLSLVDFNKLLFWIWKLC